MSLLLALWLACSVAEPPLPGVSPATLGDTTVAALSDRLDRELAGGWVPRTRHLRDDGRPRYTNRLLTEASPYLRQHAHNPVNWFPWGDEAFALAAELDRPVFLSIGYATCHWCHVMEEESFEDPAIAAFLNEHFIAVKVDRETRPDIDGLYMDAVIALNRSGGWPATLVLDPDRRPFFAATYLPPHDGDRGRAKGLLTVLDELHTGWTTDRDGLSDLARRLTAHLQQAPTGGTSALPGPALLEATVQATAARFDATHGGVQTPRKFPSQTPLRALLIAADRGDSEARSMALTTLDAMMQGGLYDHLGGGFHRYTVDPAWDVPHFEKMLYDNALLARVYGEAFQLTGDLRYARVVDETLEAMLRDLGADGGGFASALDADSLTPEGHREEGYSYLWTEAAVDEVLGDRGPAFRAAYGVTSTPDLDGQHVLREVTRLTTAERRSFRKDRLSLLLTRRKRPQPLRDDKVLTAWNGLMIDALAYNGWLFGDRSWLDEARATADRLLADRSETGHLLRVHGVGDASGTAFLDDHAYLLDGLITLFEATGETRWLDEAKALEADARARFGTPDGPWYLTPKGHEALLVRDRPVQDGAVPSPNTVLVGALYRLAALTTDDAYRERADAIVRGLPMERAPLAFARGVVAMEARHRPLREIVLVRDPGERSSGLHAAIKTLPPARRVLVQQTVGEPPVLPLAADKVRLDGPTVYVCQGGVCEQPLTDPAAVAALLEEAP